MPGLPPIYAGTYVDDIIYFSQSPKVERKFEQLLSDELGTTFGGNVDCYLGIKFDHIKHTDGSITITMSQSAFVDHMCELAHLNNPAISTPSSPYRSGLPVNLIPTEHLPDTTPTSKS